MLFLTDKVGSPSLSHRWSGHPPSLPTDETGFFPPSAQMKQAPTSLSTDEAGSIPSHRRSQLFLQMKRATSCKWSGLLSMDNAVFFSSVGDAGYLHHQWEVAWIICSIRFSHRQSRLLSSDVAGIFYICCGEPPIDGTGYSVQMMVEVGFIIVQTLFPVFRKNLCSHRKNIISLLGNWWGLVAGTACSHQKFAATNWIGDPAGASAM